MHTTFFKKAILFVFATFLLLYASGTLQAKPTFQNSDEQATVTVRGLKPGDQATIQLLVDRNDIQNLPTLFEKTVQDGTNNVLNMALLQIPDGNYKLSLNAPENYFRDPQAYLFQVRNGKIINNVDLPLTFQLNSESTQAYPPCRDIELPRNEAVNQIAPQATVVDEANIVCMAERMVSLTALPKTGEPPQENGDSEYRYIGPRTNQDNQGVWGRFTVTNPSVCHSNCSVNQEFVVVRVYANNWSTGNQRWMELGWAEHSTRDNVRYIYEYDSVDRVWNYYDALTDGTKLEVRVRNSGGNTWNALHYLGGNSWAVLRTKDLGFATAENGYNRGEVNLDGPNDPTPPSLPQTSFDKGYLYLNGVWRVWDQNYPTTTNNDGPYDTHYTNSYYNFYIHKH